MLIHRRLRLHRVGEARLGGNTLRPAMQEQIGQFVILVTSRWCSLMKALLPNDMWFLFGLSLGRSRRFAG